MEKIHIAVMLVCSWMLIGIANGESIEKDSYTYTFRVYAHEFISGPNATQHEIARAAITEDSPTEFGLMQVVDDLITSGPNYTELDKLGRAQAFEINAGLAASSVIINVDFVFTDGPYQDNIITILGRKNTSSVRQEVPIVGGIGVFRSAQGYSVSEILSYDPLTDYILFAYDFYLKSGVSADQ